MRLRLINRRTNHSSQYNLPTASEVAGLIMGDFDPNNGYRDIIVEDHDSGLQHISEIHPAFMAMQYHLLFPYGEDDFSLRIPKRSRGSTHESENSTLTMREYYASCIQQRLSEGNTIISGGRLFQQYIVDAYCCIEGIRLWWIQKKRKKKEKKRKRKETT